MPATAGRVKMPHDNRMHTSASLGTHSVWKDVIKYDPYAAADDGGAAAAADSGYEKSKALLALARLQNQHNTTRGACKKCGEVGHLTRECRNSLKLLKTSGGRGSKYPQVGGPRTLAHSHTRTLPSACCVNLQLTRWVGRNLVGMVRSSL